MVLCAWVEWVGCVLMLMAIGEGGGVLLSGLWICDVDVWLGW
jgi:hypothetical protein